MKKCPTCNQFFGDENAFCLEDGTPLLPETASAGPGGFVSSGDMPTRYISRPTAVPAPVGSSRGSSSNILYLVIGILATALVGLGAYMFLLRDNGKQTNPVNNAPPPANNTVATPPPQAAAPAVNAGNTAGAVPSPPPANPIPALAGRWAGEISYPSGSAFSAQADLTETGPGQVRGQIVWTLLRSSNPAKKDKVGVSATEYVQGSLDPSGRALNLSGNNKTDPADIIILDKYRLTVSPDGKSMSGISFGGKVRGRVSLRRF